MHDKMVPE
jgi:hypothetical protein